jgi:hypothetical protein
MKPNITLDEVTIHFPDDGLISLNDDYFVDKDIWVKKTGVVIKEYSVLNFGRDFKKPLGIKNIIYDKSKRELKFHLTAKALKSGYKKHISIETQNDLLNSVNDSGLIEIDIKRVKETATVSALDLVRDVHICKPPENYLRDLRLLGTIKNFRLKNHHSGIEFYSEAKSNKQRMVIYSKYEQLSTKKIAKTELLKYVNKEDFRDTLRIEANLRHPDLIRKNFNIEKNEDIMLSRVLNYETNVLANYFNSMWPPLKLKKSFEDIWDLKISPSEFAKKLGMRNIIEMCGFNRNNIRAYLKTKLEGKKNPSHYMRDYDKEMLIMKAEILGEKTDAECIEELRKKLQEVV